MPRTCRYCGSDNRDIAKFCCTCGISFQTSLPSGPLQAGTILADRYKIISLIKVGGMGAVYKAVDKKFDRICAVKELLPPYETQAQMQATEWFKREGNILAKLDHPNLPAVLDHFVSTGRYYLVMNYINGIDLETLLQKEGNPGLPVETVIEWAKQILAVLDYLHNQKPLIIYRDLKPSNIMLHKDGRIMLIDFGLAKAVQQTSHSKRTGIGTLGYTPREQFRGKPEARSDLYALGATIHHLLSGEMPEPFSFAPLREFIPTISTELEDVIIKALKDKPDERFSSAKEMFETLSQVKKLHRVLLPPLVQPSSIQPPTGITPEMVMILQGTFFMGSNKEDLRNTAYPGHAVHLSSYYISKYLVTNKDYSLFLESLGNQFESGSMWVYIKDDRYCGLTGGPAAGTITVKNGYENFPIVYVSWYGAVAYCNWLSEIEGLEKCYGDINVRGNVDITRNGYRLPTEAEWEFACNAEVTTEYYWGDKMNGDCCWYAANSNNNLHNVGEKQPNHYNLFDMLGNVLEWCNDWYSLYSCDVEFNPTGPPDGKNRVRRGGCWKYNAELCKTVCRDFYYPSHRSNFVGFRVVRSKV